MKMQQITTVKETETLFRNLGFTEEVTACDCCGRTELKGTYAIENIKDGGIMYYGCVCAATRMNWSKKEFITRYKTEEKEQSEAARKEYRDSQEQKTYTAWVQSLNTRFDDTTDAGWEARKQARITEGPAIHAALNHKKDELKKKYPLAKGIY